MLRSTGQTSPAIVWFRRDLRMADNPALAAAHASGRPILPVYILDEGRFFSPGGAQRWFLHGALQSLSAELQRLGAPLILRRGPESQTLRALVAESGAGAVYWNRRYAGEEIATDKALKEELQARGIETHTFNGSLLREPWELKTKTGGAFKVFTPFWRALQEAGPSRAQAPTPRALSGASNPPASDSLADWRLRPQSPDWAAAFPAVWKPVSEEAHALLSRFLARKVDSYPDDRNLPAQDATSRLSPHLALGSISPLEVWTATQAAVAAGAADESAARKFLSEIAWREFAYSLLFHFPRLAEDAWRTEFTAFPWRRDDRAFHAWKNGRTGVPIVDAGMRQLWRTGWMHNRVRMIVASFLVKNLLIDWRLGERWFWDTLVDADPANNPASWQWVAGSGADAAPYFRIFNPVAQSERFDPDGAYIRAFVPELAGLPDAHIHAPWMAPRSVLASADIRLGEDGGYPAPIVNLATTRVRALNAYRSLKEAS